MGAQRHSMIKRTKSKNVNKLPKFTNFLFSNCTAAKRQARSAGGCFAARRVAANGRGFAAGGKLFSDG